MTIGREAGTTWLVTLGLYVVLATACGGSDPARPTTMTDVDGNTYATVTIGAQVWTAESLRTTRYADGSPIPLVTDGTAWSGLTDGARCSYANDAANGAAYGLLYNWYAVSDGRALCPAGWHVPSWAEWETLVTTLGGLGVAGGRLREAGTAHWSSPNTDATNSSGFTALPAGYRYATGFFFDLQQVAFFWTSTSNGTADNASALSLFHDDAAAYDEANNDARNGLSVRCLANR